MEGIVSIENFRICSSTRKIDLCQFIEVTSEFENIGCRGMFSGDGMFLSSTGTDKNFSLR